MNHTQIDRDFFIKVYGLPEYEGKSTLKSSRKLESIVGPQLYNSIVENVYDKGLDKVVRKLRRGLTLCFYGK